MGDLVPIYLQEVVPGDKFQVNTEMLMRFAPMVAPVMHRMNVYTHYFFVPNRLVFNGWEDFITGGDDGLDATVFPEMWIYNLTVQHFGNGTLADYLGVPTPPAEITNTIKVSALPFRAYQLIYNEYYRDQNLQDKVALTKDSVVTGPEFAAITALRKRAWEKDYLTSALPFAQRGGEVSIPSTVNYKDAAQFQFTTQPTANQAIQVQAGTNPTPLKAVDGNVITEIDNIDSVDITVNDLRRAKKLQEWLEKNARAGSRYIEQILSHFGVMSSDARLQRPEYLGGGKTPVTISEVLSTVETATVPQGNMAGHGIAVGNSNRFRRGFEEHGYIFGIMSVLPRTAYQQGVPRMLSKIDKFDYYWPEFANLGEQEVLNKEVYANFVSGNPEGTFGYQSRYAEYKFGQSSVHGDFKGNLSHWHMGRIFSSQPALNGSFVTSDPTHRIFAVTEPSTHKLYAQIYNEVKAIRPMPVFGTPMF